MILRLLAVAAMGTGLLFVSSDQAEATTHNSLLVPADVRPGNYWATPLDARGGYLEVCSTYTCDVAHGMIQNYLVNGRTMVVIPAYATLVNMDDVKLTPVTSST